MKLLFALGCVTGIFTVSQSFIQISIFDFYFHLLPFGLALVSFFIAAGLTRFSVFRSIPLRSLPLFGIFAMLACVVLPVYGTSLGVSLFFALLVVLQLITYLFFWLIMVQGGRIVSSLVGFISGLVLGYLVIGHLNLDPLVVLLIAFVSITVLFATQFLNGMTANVVYALVICLAAFSVFQARPYDFMPASAGWRLDYGKAPPTSVGDRRQQIWGPAGLTEMYALTSGGRDAWLYTNGASPGLVLLDNLANYDDAWWAQKAPLAMAIYDAVQPKSIIDIGTVPSTIAWRANGRGTRNIYGVYGSRDWTLINAPGLDSMRRAVMLHPQHAFLAGNIKFPVDMIVLASAHEGKEGWTSSIAGEQRFFDQEYILRYWQGLAEDGVLVVLSRQQSTFFRQIFSVWAALKNAGMSDTEFLDHAWGVVPDGTTTDGPYRYALVLTKKQRDEKFAQALKAQVLHLPVRYLFGYTIPASRPYDYFYQNPMARNQAIFSQGISGMFGKQMSLEASTSHRSVFYQFVEDVHPQYKNMLVLSVAILLGIILFTLPNNRRIERLQSSRTPSHAIWLVTGGATGGLLVLALAFIVIYPSGTVTEGYEVPYVAALMLVATLAYRKLTAFISGRTAWLLNLAAAFTLLLYLASRFTLVGNAGGFNDVAAGILFVLLGLSLPSMCSTLGRELEAAAVGWWWLAMAAGSAAALFWSMRLYSVLGDGLLLLASLLLVCIAATLLWLDRSHAAGEGT